MQVNNKQQNKPLEVAIEMQQHTNTDPANHDSPLASPYYNIALYLKHQYPVTETRNRSSIFKNYHSNTAHNHN